MSDCPVLRLELPDGRTRCYSATLAGDRWACTVGTVLVTVPIGADPRAAVVRLRASVAQLVGDGAA